MTKEEKFERFKLKAIKVHKGYYIYNKVDYINSTKKVCIVCPLHGEFWQTPAAHVRGEHCPLCANKKRGDTFRGSKDNFILEARKTHGNKYDYSKVEYVSAMKPVEIICKEHGSFWQIPMLHIKGQGCPKCAGRYQTNDEVIERMKKSHPNEDYDYSKVEFTKMHNKVCIVCHKKDSEGNEHGEFWQTPAKHIVGRGCPKCGNERKNANRKITVDKFKERGSELFKGFYDYQYVNFNDLHDKVKIICPVHGEFEQYACDHLNGHGCQQCAVDESKLTTADFIKKSKIIHGEDKWIYDKVKCNGTKTKVCIICPIHGEYWQTPETHLKGCGCPKCGKIISKNEEELYQFVCNLVGSDNIVRNDRDMLNGKEIDIYIPSLKVGIEYNGVVWHSEKFGKGRNYHIDKLNAALEKGVKLIQIFEDEYIDHKNIVFGKIRHLLGFDNYQQKIFARKCEIKEIERNVAKGFYEINHIQGYAKSTKHIGAFYNGELIGVMSFNLIKKDNSDWELTRFATDITKLCCGVGGKLFNYFVKKYNPSYIKSFADRRWTLDKDNNLYTKIGFVLEDILKPEYRYIESSGYQRIHKFNFRKQRLSKLYNLPLSMTETEMCDEIGVYKIWDCGLLKYVWKK